MSPAATRQKLALICFFATGTGICATAPAATRHTQSFSQAVMGAPDADFDEDFGTSSTIESSCTSASNNAFGHGFAVAGFKTVGAFANANKADTPAGFGEGTGQATSKDTLTFFVPDLPVGESIQVNVSVSVHGELAGGASCPVGSAYFYSTGSFELQIGPPNQTPTVYDVASGFIDNDPKSPDSGIQEGNFTLALSWLNGDVQQMTLSAFAACEIASPQPCTGEAKAQLGNTLRWNGVVSVTDSLGNPVTNYTLTDEFGRNWATPAPLADVTYDGLVNVDDLLAVINGWGACGDLCPADINDDASVNVDDLLAVINGWGG